MHARQLSSHRSAQLAAHAAVNRSRLTASESALWAALSARELGVTFRRQYPVGEYIVDFAAPSVGVVVEVDGEYHSDKAPGRPPATGGVTRKATEPRNGPSAVGTALCRALAR